jgi:hypothetical protein
LFDVTKATAERRKKEKSEKEILQKKWLLKITKIDEKLKTKQLETNSECFSFSITSSIIISFVTQRGVYITVDWGICM